MNEQLLIKFGEAIGPFKLGMSRNEIWSQFKYPINCFYKTDLSKYRTDSIELLGVHAHYNESEKCEFIELWFPVEYNAPIAMLDDMRLNDLNMGEVSLLIELLDINASKNDYGYESPESGIGFYCHSFENEKSKLDGVYIMYENQENS